jgi:TPR repeat protein
LAKNPAEAVRWYRAGATLADALAMFALAQAQEAGLGVSKDRQQAIQWYRKSAGLGYPNAVDRLQNLDQ